VRSQYSSVANDLNVVDGCETLILASLSNFGFVISYPMMAS